MTDSKSRTKDTKRSIVNGVAGLSIVGERQCSVETSPSVDKPELRSQQGDLDGGSTQELGRQHGEYGEWPRTSAGGVEKKVGVGLRLGVMWCTGRLARRSAQQVQVPRLQVHLEAGAVCRSNARPTNQPSPTHRSGAV